VRRREFIALLRGMAVAWPIAARAQQPERMRRIGVLMGHPENDLEGPAWFAAFREGLEKLGWVEDRNIRFDTRWTTPEDAEARRRFAKELVALQPHSFFRLSQSQRPRCWNKRAPFQSFSRPFPIRSAAASSRAWRDRAATSPTSRRWLARWLASGWSCSRRLRRVLLGSRCCSTRHRRHMPSLS
jgi:hypothetical protein